MNGNYANFLNNSKKDFEAAEKYFLKALEIQPDDANINANYANLLIVIGKKEEALKYIHKAFELNDGKESDTAIELWFYCYAVFPGLFSDSKQKIEALLEKGVRSPHWDFSEILKIAKVENHPDYEQLVEFDKMITEP
ncbi:MAG: tetratricopeptide repeat protein [Saprospiraceae bacterium]|nr:tetratricopeptide repeat protein [Saprospiraceae bacterium]